MPAPLSNDLRKRVIEYYELGERQKNIAEMLRMSETTVFRLIKQYKERGTYEPLPQNGGRPSALYSEQFEEIRLLIRSHPDIELKSIKEILSLPISIPAIWTIVTQKLGFVRKKNPSLR